MTNQNPFTELKKKIEREATLSGEDINTLYTKKMELNTIDPLTDLPFPIEEPTPIDCLEEFYKEIQTERFKPIPTGLKQLDKALEGGLTRKQLITLASAPGMGKTAISQFIFENMARNGHPVIYVNLEMDRSQLLSRSISRLAYDRLRSTQGTKKGPGETWEDVAAKYNEISTSSIMRGYKWNEDQKARIKEAIDCYRKTIAPNFYYVTTNPENTGYITNELSKILEKLERLTQLIKEDGREEPLICIDYLQFIEYDLTPEGERKPDTAEAIKETLRALKVFAMKNNTVVWLIMANNRTSNKEGRATMDSGRDTSNIEYSGDVMLSLTYTAIEEKWKHEAGTDKNGNTKRETIDLEFINDKIDYCKRSGKDIPIIARLQSLKVVKGRNMSSRGSAKFIYNGKYSTFEEDNGTENPYYDKDEDKDL